MNAEKYKNVSWCDYAVINICLELNTKNTWLGLLWVKKYITLARSFANIGLPFESGSNLGGGVNIWRREIFDLTFKLVINLHY